MDPLKAFRDACVNGDIFSAVNLIDSYNVDVSYATNWAIMGTMIERRYLGSIQLFIDKGMTFGSNARAHPYVAAIAWEYTRSRLKEEKEKWMRILVYFLDQGCNPDVALERNGWPPERAVNIASEIRRDDTRLLELLLCRGATIPDDMHFNLAEYIADRERCRSTTIAILGLRRASSRTIGGNNRDVMGILGRMVWHSRCSDGWMEPEKRARIHTELPE